LHLVGDLFDLYNDAWTYKIYPPKYYKYFSQKKRSKAMCKVLRGSRKKSIRKVRINRIIKINVEVNPLNTELNPICYLLALLGAHHFKLLTFRLLMSYMYME